MGMLRLHNDIFLTDIAGCGQLKFRHIYTPNNEILGALLLMTYLHVRPQNSPYQAV